MCYFIKRKFWSGEMLLYRDDYILGEVKPAGFWNSHIQGSLENKRYTFYNRGAFSTRIEIVDEAENLIGKIRYSKWSSKAKIDLNGKLYRWFCSNFWGTRWELVDESGREIFLEKNEFHVNSNSSNDDEFLFFLSTYLFYNYHQKMAAAT